MLAEPVQTSFEYGLITEFNNRRYYLLLWRVFYKIGTEETNPNKRLQAIGAKARLQPEP